MNCGTCKYWEASSFGMSIDVSACDHPKVYSNFHAVYMDNGKEIKETTPIDGLSCTGLGQNRQFVKTGKDFGCIHYESN